MLSACLNPHFQLHLKQPFICLVLHFQIILSCLVYVSFLFSVNTHHSFILKKLTKIQIQCPILRFICLTNFYFLLPFPFFILFSHSSHFFSNKCLSHLFICVRLLLCETNISKIIKTIRHFNFFGVIFLLVLI